MGTHPSKNINNLNTQMSNLQKGEIQYFDQIVNYSQCCGFKIRKVHKLALIWQETIVKSCQDLKSDYPYWTQQVIEIVKHKQLPRSPYLKQVNELKDMQNQPILERQSILLTPSEIEEFKDNLKKSILLSSAQAIKARPKETSKIESVIMTPTKKSRVKTRNEEILTQFRRSDLKSNYKMDQRDGSGIKVGKSGFRQSMISLVDDTLSSLIKGHEKQISKRSALSLQIFVKFTILLQKHLSDVGNKLHHLILCFIHQMDKHYNKPIKKSQQIQVLVNNVKAFLVILRDAVQDYYNTMSFGDLNQNTNYLISNSENILTVVTAILFKNKRFYSFLFGHIKQFNSEKDEEVIMIIDSLSGKKPEYFQVRDQYCLNDCTLTQLIQNEVQIKQFYQKNDFPYSQCCYTLNQIQNTKTPISKMKKILESAQKIIYCVKQFYQFYGLQMNNWILDADQILSIFCYMITKTSLKNFHSEMFILENFATQNQMISMMGYYYSVLSCALQQLTKNYQSQIKTQYITEQKK